MSERITGAVPGERAADGSEVRRCSGTGPHAPAAKAATSAPEQGARQPAYQTLADELREQIVSGRLRPGERLPTEPQLCVRSGLSRSTVREALRLLSSQHLIVTTRGVSGGSFVAEPSAAQLGDSLATAMQVLRSGMVVRGEHFLEIRELIEVPGAALAARRRTEEDLRELLGLVVDPEVPEVEVKLSTYWRFRATLVAAVHNPLFELLAYPLRQMANDRELVAAGPAELWHQAAEADCLIADCVQRQDSEGAATATRDHLRYLSEVYQKSQILLAN